MSLSEQELRALREIEQSLMADDPKFGSTVSAVGLEDTPTVSVSLRGIAVIMLGLVLMVGGIALSQQNLWFVALGVFGFLVMFGAGIWMLRGNSASNAGSNAVPLSRNGRGAQRSSGGQSGSGFSSRMEENFRRRFEDRP